MKSTNKDKGYILPAYYSGQLNIEKSYHDDMSVIVNQYIAKCSEYIDPSKNGIPRGEIKATRLVDTLNDYLLSRSGYINIINKHLTNFIYRLIEQTIPTGRYAEWRRNHDLYDDISLRTKNMFNSILNRYASLIPVGYKLTPPKTYYTEENTENDVAERSRKTFDKFVQFTITQAVSSLLIDNAIHNGYTEYRGENQNDDKVRETHRFYFDDTHWIRFDSPPPCGHPGEEYNCRCFIKAVR